MGTWSLELGDFSNQMMKMVTLRETNALHLKLDGWNTIVSFWELAPIL